MELSSQMTCLIDLARIGLGIAFIPDYCLSRESKDLYVVKTKENSIPSDGSFDKSNFASITVYGRIFKNSCRSYKPEFNWRSVADSVVRL
mgnify:CR=1 FL=1